MPDKNCPAHTDTPRAESQIIVIESSVLDRAEEYLAQRQRNLFLRKSFDQLLEQIVPQFSKNRAPTCSLSKEDEAIEKCNSALIKDLKALRTALLLLISSEGMRAHPFGPPPSTERTLSHLLGQCPNQDLLALAEKLIATNNCSCKPIDISNLEAILKSGSQQDLIKEISAVFEACLHDRWDLLIAFAEWFQKSPLFAARGFCALENCITKVTDSRSLLEEALIQKMLREERERLSAANRKLAKRKPDIAESIILAYALEKKAAPSSELQAHGDTEFKRLLEDVEQIKKDTFAREDGFCDRVGAARELERRTRAKKANECYQEKEARKQKVREFLAGHLDIDESDKARLLDLHFRKGPYEAEFAEIDAKIRAKRARKTAPKKNSPSLS